MVSRADELTKGVPGRVRRISLPQAAGRFSICPRPDPKRSRTRPGTGYAVFLSLGSRHLVMTRSIAGGALLVKTWAAARKPILLLALSGVLLLRIDTRAFL